VLVAIGLSVEVTGYLAKAFIADAFDKFLHEPVVVAPFEASSAHGYLFGTRRNLVGMQIVQPELIDQCLLDLLVQDKKTVGVNLAAFEFERCRHVAIDVDRLTVEAIAGKIRNVVLAFRGSVTAREHDWSEAQVRDFVVARKSTNPHLCKAVAPSGGQAADPRRGSADGRQHRQAAGAAARTPPIKRGVTRLQPHISRQSAQCQLRPQVRKYRRNALSGARSGRAKVEYVNCDTPNSASSEFIDHGLREREHRAHLYRAHPGDTSAR